MSTAPESTILNPVEGIKKEVEKAKRAPKKRGIFSVKKANDWIKDSRERPDPRSFFHGLIVEYECTVIFASSGVGKSIYVTQIAEDIAWKEPLLFIDLELADKQFQMRYTDPVTNQVHMFPDNFERAEIDPELIVGEDLEEAILDSIEDSAKRGIQFFVLDNITFACNDSEKGATAGQFMMKIIRLKKKYHLTIIVIAHTPKRPGSTAQFLRDFVIEICLGRCHIAVAKAHRIKEDNRSAGGEVNVNRTDVLLVIRNQAVRSHALAGRVTGFPVTYTDDGIVESLAGESGGGIQPVGLDENLLPLDRRDAQRLQVERSHIGLAPVILNIGRDDDRLAPAAGNTRTLRSRHLHHQLVGRRLVLYAGEGNQGRGNIDLFVSDIGNGPHRCRSVGNQSLAGHRPVSVEADVHIDAGELGLLSEDGSTGGVLRQALPFLHLGIGECLIRLGDFCHRGSAYYLSVCGHSRRPRPDGKDGTSVNLTGRNTLCRTGEAPESDGRKSLHLQ